MKILETEISDSLERMPLSLYPLLCLSHRSKKACGLDSSLKKERRTSTSVLGKAVRTASIIILGARDREDLQLPFYSASLSFALASGSESRERKEEKLDRFPIETTLNQG